MALGRRLAELDRRIFGQPGPRREAPAGLRAVNGVLAVALVLLTAYVAVFAFVDGELPRWPIALFSLLLSTALATTWLAGR